MKESMVTRTIITTRATCLCLNTETAEPFSAMVTVPRTYKDNEALLKAVKKVVEHVGITDPSGNTYYGEPIVVAKVVGSTEIETLYGMTESEFLSNAKVLPPRGTKQAETDEATPLTFYNEN